MLRPGFLDSDQNLPDHQARLRASMNMDKPMARMSAFVKRKGSPLRSMIPESSAYFSTALVASSAP